MGRSRRKIEDFHRSWTAGQEHSYNRSHDCDGPDGLWHFGSYSGFYEGLVALDSGDVEKAAEALRDRLATYEAGDYVNERPDESAGFTFRLRRLIEELSEA